jgi:putative oxidoreductase
MKIAAMIARLLLGLIFLVFGLNGLHPFLPMPPPPPGLAGQFMGALMASHYYVFIALVQTIGGLLLLVNRFVPLALVMLGAMIVNILCVHIFLLHGVGLPLALLVTVLWLIVAVRNKRHLAGIFAPRTE